MNVVFFLLLLPLLSSAQLPPGTGSVAVSVNQASYKTGETIVAMLGAPEGISANETMLHVVVRRCNAILQSTCTEHKYREWRMQPFQVVAPVSARQKGTFFFFTVSFTRPRWRS